MCHGLTPAAMASCQGPLSPLDFHTATLESPDPLLVFCLEPKSESSKLILLLSLILPCWKLRPQEVTWPRSRDELAHPLGLGPRTPESILSLVSHTPDSSALTLGQPLLAVAPLTLDMGPSCVCWRMFSSISTHWMQ